MINIHLINGNSQDLERIKYRLQSEIPGEVIITSQGKEDFLHKVTWIEPDLIICDYQLLEGNGLEVLLINRQEWNVPFLFVTKTPIEPGSLDNLSKTVAEGYYSLNNLDELIKFIKDLNLINHTDFNMKKDSNIDYSSNPLFQSNQLDDGQRINDYKIDRIIEYLELMLNKINK